MIKHLRSLFFAYVWEKFRPEFENRFIDELLLDIPEKVARPALDLIAKDQATLIRFLYFEASHTFRRDPSDFTNIERRNGMLLFIKAFIMAIGRLPESTVKHVEGIGDTVAPPDEWQVAALGVQAAEDFKKRKTPEKKPEE